MSPAGDPGSAFGSRGDALLLAAVGALALFASGGCKRDRSEAGSPPPARLRVGEVAVSWYEVDGLDVRRDGRSETRIEGTLLAAIARSGLIEAGAPDRSPLELAVVAGSAERGDAASPGQGSIAIRCTLRTTLDEGWRIAAYASTSAEIDGGPEASQEAVEKVVESLVESLSGQMELFGLDLASLRSRVAATADPGIRSTGVRLLGERRDARSVAMLSDLLDGAPAGDPIIADIVGALGKIGDPSAVPSIASAFGRAEPGTEVAFVDAVAACGGGEARAFLEVVASGHRSPLVRSEAAERLADAAGGP